MNSKNTDKKGSVCQKLREVEMDQFSENEIDNYGKATVCQKAPDKTQMDAMIQRSKDYGLKVAAPNMKTDTQAFLENLADFEAKSHESSAWIGPNPPASEVTAEGRREDRIIAIAKNYKAQADKLAEALRGLIAEVKLGKLNVRKDFSLMNAHAYAGKCLHQYESEVQR